MTLTLVLAAACSFVVTLILVPIVIRFALSREFVDRPGPRKSHAVPMPYGGGLAVAAGFLATMVAWIGAGALFEMDTVAQAPRLVLLGSCALVILVLGVADDRWKLSPRSKLLVETLVAIGYVAGGGRLSLFWEGSALADVAGSAVTVLWIVGVTNAFNLLDHMDGLTGGVTALVAAAFAVIAVATGQGFVAVALAALGGAAAAFLCFNFPPARIYLGDGGSLFVGFVLAALTVTFTFYEPAAHRPPTAWAIPLVVLAVPLYDTTSVVVSRWRRRRPIFEGDRNHVAHRLVALGMTPRGAALTVYAMTAMTGLAAILLLQLDASGAAIVLAQLALTFGIIALLDRTGRSHVDGTK